MKKRQVRKQPATANLLMPTERHLPGRESHEQHAARLQEIADGLKETVLVGDVLNNIMDNNQIKTMLQMVYSKNIGSYQFNIRIPLRL